MGVPSHRYTSSFYPPSYSHVERCEIKLSGLASVTNIFEGCHAQGFRRALMRDTEDSGAGKDNTTDERQGERV